MRNLITLEIPGYGDRELATAILPPAGTQFRVSRNLTDSEEYLFVEVTGHEWQLHEFSQDDDKPYFTVRITTRLVE